IPDPLDELTQLGAIGYDDEVAARAAPLASSRPFPQPDPSPQSPSSVTSLCRVLACEAAAPSVMMTLSVRGLVDGDEDQAVEPLGVEVALHHALHDGAHAPPSDSEQRRHGGLVGGAREVSHEFFEGFREAATLPLRPSSARTTHVSHPHERQESLHFQHECLLCLLHAVLISLSIHFRIKLEQFSS